MSRVFDGSERVTDPERAMRIEARVRVTGAVLLRGLDHELDRQTAKWETQDHTLGNWMLILTEEVGEVAEAIIQGRVDDDVWAEMTQVVAVLIRMLEKATRPDGD